MQSVRSKDRTRIAFQALGSGPPLILVHGIGAASSRWGPVLAALADHFRVYALDRRGRGESGDGPKYALTREAEDLASLVDSLAAPAYVLGHSFGGLVALEAALLTPHLQKLILYEPPVILDGAANVSLELIERLEAFLAAGDREAVLRTFVQEVLRMSPHDFESYRASPAFPGRLAAAHTLPRELRAQLDYRFEPERFRHLAVPARLLLGGESPAFYRAAVEALDASLPESRIVVLPGQKHIAMDSAPELFLHTIVSFLQEDDGGR